jgi:hypothetical protein
MSFTDRELWTVIHGMGFGAIFLLAFAGGFAGLWSYRPEFVTTAGIRERLHRLLAGTWIMAIMAWLTVISGTYKVYPWYRAMPPEGADLKAYPRYYLLADENLAGWHTFAMEWKEHVAWMAPILATAVAFVVLRYGASLTRQDALRRACLILFTLAFLAAAIAGAFGAFITKAAPVT